MIKLIIISSFNWLELQFRNFMHNCIQMKHIQSQLLRHSSRLCPEGLFKFDTQVLPGRNFTSFNKLFIIFMKGRTSNFKRRLSAINFLVNSFEHAVVLLQGYYKNMLVDIWSFKLVLTNWSTVNTMLYKNNVITIKQFM